MTNKVLRRLLVATCLFSQVAFASITGAIKGTAADPSGAFLSNAHVTVTEEATNETRSFVTDATRRMRSRSSVSRGPGSRHSNLRFFLPHRRDCCSPATGAFPVD
jgi:hypothetical protein